MLKDVRFAIRQLKKSPNFAIVTVLTLALGIGANTGIFTLLDQAILRKLPVLQPDQLVRLRFVGFHEGGTYFFGGDANDYFSYPSYRELRDKSTVFDGLIADAKTQVGVSWKDEPELAAAELVSGNYFDSLGITPVAGRLILPADDSPHSGNPVVAISFRYWKSRFNSDLDVIGKILLVNGQPFTIIGVAPPEFGSLIAGYSPKVFLPISSVSTTEPVLEQPYDIRSAWLTLTGRLKHGVSRDGAEAGINPLWHSIRAGELSELGNQERMNREGFLRDSKLLLLDNSRGFSPLRDEIQQPVLILMGMVGLVLLMACVNVSTLLMVRAAGRKREMSVRYALGASRWQIGRQLLVEGFTLGFLGSTLGLFLAPAISSLLSHNLIHDPTVALSLSAKPDLRVLSFNFATAIVVSLVFSLTPMMRFLYPDLVNSLKQQTSTATAKHLSYRRISVGVQIGLSLILLVGAGLLVQTLRNLLAVDVGFTTEHLLGFGINPQLAGYSSGRAVLLQEQILHRLAALPGVLSVAATDDPELMGEQSMTGILLPDHPTDRPIMVENPAVTPEYFRTLGIPLLAGRGFDAEDLPDKPIAVIVNSLFARTHFGSPQNAIGKLLQHGNNQGKSDVQIVGVVGDTKHVDMRTGVVETLYRAASQFPNSGFSQFYIRTSQGPRSTKADIRTAVRNMDSNLIVDSLRTMDEQRAESTTSDQLIAWLAAAFGLLATLMVAIGLYGVLAYNIMQRTLEIGIRMALGAERGDVVRLVVSDVLLLTILSLAASVPCSLLLSDLLRSQLFNVSPTNPTVILSAILLIAFVTALATAVPARRAAALEPMQSLRSE
jgi:putative ABC transport system permease protein